MAENRGKFQNLQDTSLGEKILITLVDEFFLAEEGLTVWQSPEYFIFTSSSFGRNSSMKTGIILKPDPGASVTRASVLTGNSMVARDECNLDDGMRQDTVSLIEHVHNSSESRRRPSIRMDWAQRSHWRAKIRIYSSVLIGSDYPNKPHH